MKFFVQLCLLSLISQSLCAQQGSLNFNPALSQDQISVAVSVYSANSGNELNEGINYGIDWYHNFTPVFGVRGGVAFVQGLEDGIHLARLPLGVTLRISRYGTGVERFVYSAANYISSSDHDFSSALISFIPFDVEFTAGITPGVLLGSRESKSLAVTGGDSYKHGVRVRHRFSATADVGGSLSLRISRVVLRLTPMYHYSLTDNFDLFSDLSSDSKTSRSFFSFGGGVAWMF